MTHPDRAEIRRKALLAAATVTLAMGLPGCADAGKDAVDTDDPSTDTELAARDTSGGADTSVGHSDVTDTDPGETDSLVADTDLLGDPKPDCGTLDVTACCDALVAWCTVNVPPDTGTSYEDCVYGPGFDGSTGCIPWGPPVPPRASVA